MQSVEVQARTVDEAVGIALGKLGRRFEEVDVEILRPGSPGILGVGAEDALVRVTIRPAGMPPRPPFPVPPQPGQPPFYGSPVLPPMGVPAQTTQRQSFTPQELAEIGREVLTQILRRMRIQARPQIQLHQPVFDPTSGEESESPLVTINLVGNDLGTLIGRRGETLTDLQFIFNLIMNKKTRTWGRVMIDVEGYRTRRKDNLINLARRMADQVLATRQPITLEPMPAYERRLVHLALLDHPYIRTESFGEGEERKVTIFPK
jgi:spoIIIJ-associated protein